MEVVRAGLGGQAFLEHLFCVLYRQRRIQELCTETSRFTCHEGVQLVRGLARCANDPERVDVAEALVHVFLVRDLLLASPFCCTRELMGLWCRLQRMQSHALPQVAGAALRLLLPHAANSAQFYLFCDVLWEHYGRRLFPIYLDLMVRGLTTDLNTLQSALHRESLSNIREMEVHIASVLLKLATLFPNSPELSRECVLSAFALDPTEERLAQLESLTEQVQAKSASSHLPKEQDHSGSGKSIAERKVCRCGGRCTVEPVLQKTTPAQEDGRPEYEMDFWHPILSQQLEGVPYVLLKDFVTVLECVRPKSVHLCSDWRCHLERFESRQAAQRSRTPPEYCGTADSETDSPSEEEDGGAEARQRARAHVQKLLDSAGMPVKRRDKRRANAKCKSSRKKKKKSSKKHKKEAHLVDNAAAEFGLAGLVDSTGLDMAGLGSAELGLTRLGATELDSAELGPMELCPTGLDSAGLEAAGLDSTELDATGLETIGLDSMELDPTALGPPLQEEKAHDSLQVGMPKVKKKAQRKGSHRKKDGFASTAGAPSGGGCLQTLRIVLERFDRLSGTTPNHMVNKKSSLRIVPVLSLPNITLEEESKRACLWTDGATTPKQPLSNLNLPQGPAFQRVASAFEARLQDTPLKRFLRYQIKRPTFQIKKTVPVKVSMRSVKNMPLAPAAPVKSAPVPKAMATVAVSKAAAATISKTAAVTAPKAMPVATPKVVPVPIPGKGTSTAVSKAPVATPPKVPPVPVSKAPHPHAIITRPQPAAASKVAAVMVPKAPATVMTKAPAAVDLMPVAVTVAKNSPMVISNPASAMVRPLKDYAKVTRATAVACSTPYVIKTSNVPTSTSIPAHVATSAAQSSAIPPAILSTDAIDLPKHTVETTIQVQVPTTSCVMSPTPPPLPSHMVSLQHEASPAAQALPNPATSLSEAVAEAVMTSQPQAVQQAVPQAVQQAVPQAVPQAVQQAVPQTVPQPMPPPMPQPVPQPVAAPRVTLVTSTATPMPQPTASCSVQASQLHSNVSSGASVITSVSTDASQVFSQLKQGQATVLRLPVYSRAVQQQVGQAGIKTDSPGVCMLPMKILNAAMLSGQDKVLNVGNQKIAINALPSLLAASTSGSTTLSTTMAGAVVSNASPNVVSAKIVPTVVGAQNVQAMHQLQQLMRLNTIPGTITQVNAAGNTTVLSADQLAGQPGLTNITALTVPLQGGLVGGRVIAGKIMIPVNSLLQQGSALTAGGMPVIILKNHPAQAKIVTDASNLVQQVHMQQHVQVQQQVQQQVQIQPSIQIQQQVQQLQQQLRQQQQQQQQNQQAQLQPQQIQQVHLQQLQPNGSTMTPDTSAASVSVVDGTVVVSAAAAVTVAATSTVGGVSSATAAVKKTWMPIRSKPGAMEYRKACNMPPVKVTKAKFLAPVSSQQQVPIVYTSPQASVSVTGATRVVAQPVCKTVPVANLPGVTHLTMPTMQMGVPMAMVAPNSVAGQITVPVSPKMVTRQLTVPLARLLQKPAPSVCKPAEASASLGQPQSIVSAPQTPQAVSTVQTAVVSAQNAAATPVCIKANQATSVVVQAEEDIQKPEIDVTVTKSPPTTVPVTKAAAAAAAAGVANQRTGIHLPFPEDLVDPSPSGATYVPVHSAELIPTGRGEKQKEEEESAKAYRRRKAALAMKARSVAAPKPQPLSQSTSKSLTAICDAVRCSLMISDDEKDKVDAQATIKECQEYELDYSSDDSSDCSVEDLFEEKALQRRLQHEEELNSILYVSDSVASEPDCDPYQWSSQSSLLLEQLNSDGDARDTMTPSSVSESIFEGGSSLSKKLAIKAKISSSAVSCQENGLQSPSKFTCERCNRGFFSAYNLRRHQKNVHKMVFKSLLVPSQGSRDTPSPQQRVVAKQPSRNTPTPQLYKTPKHSPQPSKRTLFSVAEDDESSSPDKVFCAQSVDEDRRLSFESPGLPSDSEGSPLYGIKDEPSEPGISSLICDNASFNVIHQAPLDFFPTKEDEHSELSLSDMVTGSGVRQPAPKSFVSRQAKGHGSPELSKNLDPADILESLEVAKMSAWTSTSGPLANRGGDMDDCKLDDEVNDAMEAEAGLESLLGKEAGANHSGDGQDDIDDIQPTVQHMGVSDIKDDDGHGSQEPWDAADQAALLEDIKAVESLGEYGTDSLDFFVAPRNVMSMQDQEGLLNFTDSSPPPQQMGDQDDVADMSDESDGGGGPALANEKLLEPRVEEGDEKPCTSHCRTRSREASVKRSCPCCEDSSPRKRLTRSSSSSGKTRSATKKVVRTR
ncbi:hypothetical protein V5799_014538 [Amblyomma americanum]|uniref:C2H2-type domain-containing protein n=2 Tax=Amblyomma americanum TaxID=6943 RepID=A0AAQ4E2R1_AMBAM